jgi:hypothetical protein
VKEEASGGFPARIRSSPLALLLLQSLHTFRKSSSTQSQWQRIESPTRALHRMIQPITKGSTARWQIYMQINKAICQLGNTRQITQRQAKMRDRRDYYTHLGSFIFFLSCPPPLSDCSSYPRGCSRSEARTKKKGEQQLLAWEQKVVAR